jgi:hypothetical protein
MKTFTLLLMLFFIFKINCGDVRERTFDKVSYKLDGVLGSLKVFVTCIDCNGTTYTGSIPRMGAAILGDKKSNSVPVALGWSDIEKKVFKELAVVIRDAACRIH